MILKRLPTLYYYAPEVYLSSTTCRAYLILPEAQLSSPSAMLLSLGTYMLIYFLSPRPALCYLMPTSYHLHVVPTYYYLKPTSHHLQPCSYYQGSIYTCICYHLELPSVIWGLPPISLGSTCTSHHLKPTSYKLLFTLCQLGDSKPNVSLKRQAD